MFLEDLAEDERNRKRSTNECILSRQGSSEDWVIDRIFQTDCSEDGEILENTNLIPTAQVWEDQNE
jgi:hypothetical protein